MLPSSIDAIRNRVVMVTAEMGLVTVNTAAGERDDTTNIFLLVLTEHQLLACGMPHSISLAC